MALCDIIVVHLNDIYIITTPIHTVSSNNKEKRHQAPLSPHLHPFRRTNIFYPLQAKNIQHPIPRIQCSASIRGNQTPFE